MLQINDTDTVWAMKVYFFEYKIGFSFSFSSALRNMLEKQNVVKTKRLASWLSYQNYFDRNF
jgi:hypothetical protein